MPDGIQPVGAMIKTPDPNQGISTISGILGLQQQRQALQTGQYLQQGAQATAQMTQQDAANRAAAGSFFKNFDIAKHHGDDGKLDLDSALTSPEFKATGDAAPEITKSLLAIKNSQLAAKQGLANLNGTLRGQFSSQVAGLAQDPDVKDGNQTGRGKVLDAIEQFGKVGGADAQRVAAVYGQVLQNTPPERMSQALQNLQLQAKSAGEQIDLSIPSQDKTAAGQTVNVNKLTGARSLPPGSNDQTNPSSPTVAAKTGYNVGTASGDVARANEVGDLGQSASATVQLTKRVDQLAGEINSGHLAAMVAKGSNYLGFSSVAQARTELQKDLGQLRGAVAGRAGSDSRAAEILEGYPTDTTPEQTIHAAMDYIRGTARQNIARNQLLAEYKKGDPTNLRGFQAADNALVTNSNPLMHEYLALKPEERGEFYRRNFRSAQNAQEFKDSVTALQKHTRLLSAPNE